MHAIANWEHAAPLNMLHRNNLGTNSAMLRRGVRRQRRLAGIPRFDWSLGVVLRSRRAAVTAILPRCCFPMLSHFERSRSPIDVRLTTEESGVP